MHNKYFNKLILKKIVKFIKIKLFQNEIQLKINKKIIKIYEINKFQFITFSKNIAQLIIYNEFIIHFIDTITMKETIGLV